MLNKYNSGIYIYLRVSTKSQQTESNGLDNQKSICEQYIKENYGPISNLNIEYYNDVASSYNNPNALTNLNKLIRKINSNSIIIVGDVSRLGRNCFQVFTLLRKIKKLNSIIVAVNDELIYNNSNRLIDKKFYNKIIEAEHSSDLKSIKSKERAQYIKKNNGYLGKAFYGTQIVKINNIPKLYKNQNEISNINLMKSQYQILKNFDMVATYLNNKKKYNRNNIKWSGLSIKNILKKHYPNILSNIDTNNNSIMNSIPDLLEKSNSIGNFNFNKMSI